MAEGAIGLEQLVGAWRLVSWETCARDGSVTFPYGKDLTGLLIFSESGFMSGQILLPQNGALDARHATVAGPQRYIAYCGPFRFDPDSMKLTTRVQASVSRSWIGTDQVRRVEVDGNVLRLRPPPRPSGEESVLVWERL